MATNRMNKLISVLAVFALTIPAFSQSQGVSMRATNGVGYGNTAIHSLIGEIGTGNVTNAAGSRVAYLSDTNGLGVLPSNVALLNTNNSGFLTAGVGEGNTFLGRDTGTNITTGTWNTLIGFQAAKALTTGLSDIFIGYQAGLNASNASFNTIIGTAAASVGAYQGSNNTFIGRHSAQNMLTGTRNTYLGHLTGVTGTTNNDNTFIGFLAGTAAASTRDSTLVGSESGKSLTTGNENTAVGYESLLLATTSPGNTAVGWKAGAAVTTGQGGNVLIGNEAGLKITTGAFNVCIGQHAGGENLTGAENIFLGVNSGGNGVSGHFSAGSSGHPVTNIFFAEGIADASPASSVINGTAGNGTDIAGGSIAIAGGKSTGSGVGGSIRLFTSPASTTGTSTNALVLAAIVDSDGLITMSKNLLVTNGIASYRSNLLAAATITVGASPSSWTNTLSPACSVNVYVDSSLGATTVDQNGTTLFGSFAGTQTVGLQPGEYITFTYLATAPTAKFKPFP